MDNISDQLSRVEEKLENRIDKVEVRLNALITQSDQHHIDRLTSSEKFRDAKFLSIEEKINKIDKEMEKGFSKISEDLKSLRNDVNNLKFTAASWGGGIAILTTLGIGLLQGFLKKIS